jgi:hypothetical protein
MARVFHVALVALAPALAYADSKPGPVHPYPAGTRLGSSHVMVVEPTEAFTGNSGAAVSPIIYANRCTGGCMVTLSDHNDAKNHLSTMVKPGTSTLGEFANDMGQTGSAADAEWAQVMQCLKEVYSPFNIMVTDVLPPSNVNWTELMIGGQPTDLGFPVDVLGIAPAHIDCNAYDNAIAFSFANHEPLTDRVYNICWTAAQESAHNFGLDHEYQFSDGTSACNDPMTYRVDCGGEKFFRNKGALCGENQVRACLCPGNQNSHQKILSVFGAGTPITPPPTTSVVLPAQGATIANGAIVDAKAYSQRGIDHVDLYLNGHQWGTAKGAAFGSEGQPETTYPITIPNTVPNSVIDIQIKAYDDLLLETDSAIVTVTKGAPCTDATTCLKGQKCDAGKCFWDPPTGELGVDCTYNEFCVSGLCAGTDTKTICTQTCIVGSTDACPTGYDCVATSASMGICFPPDSGGCCSVDHDTGHAVWVHIGLGGLVIGLVLRRRRRR